MTKYKEGDMVTIRLDKYDASNLEGDGLGFWKKQNIVKQEPAPEPVVGYVYVNTDDLDGFPFRGTKYDRVQSYGGKILPKIKLTYCTITKSVKAEVIS